jgi:hypothetical protein
MCQIVNLTTPTLGDPQSEKKKFHIFQSLLKNLY